MGGSIAGNVFNSAALAKGRLEANSIDILNAMMGELANASYVLYLTRRDLHQLSHALFATMASPCVTRSQPRSAKGSGSAGPCRSAIGPDRSGVWWSWIE